VIGNTCLYGSWELIADGVVDLALMLLDISVGIGKPDAKLKLMWKLGEDLLQIVVKTKLSIASVIIKQLGKRIMFSKVSNLHNLDCVHFS
jgi:hypothetical protein